MSRESRSEVRSLLRSPVLAFAMLLALAGFAGGASAAHAQETAGDGSITGASGVVAGERCPGGECGAEELGDGREDVTEPGEVTGDPREDVDCEGDSCEELPRPGELGGITKDCPECVVEEVPSEAADDLGLNRSTEVAPDKAAAVAIPACQGNNTGTAFNNNILMGGPMVAIRWIPSASVTVDAIDVWTGESTAPSRLAIWSDDPNVVGGKPLAHLTSTASWNSSLPNGWQGAVLSSPISVTAGARYWVVWDPTGGEQASVQNAGTQQPYWGSFSGTVTGGASWFGPFSHFDHAWKFRMRCGNGPCDGNNHTTTAHLDTVSMGGPTVAIAWTPTVTGPITRIELYTGETTGQNQVGLRANNAGVPGAVLGSSNNYNSTAVKGWQGANLNTPVNVVAGTLYWVTWDPVSQQAPVQNTGIQQTYWGCTDGGNAATCNAWNGPFNFTDRRWKFRVFCKDGPCDGNNHQDTNHLDPVLMGGPMVGIRWVAGASNTVSGVEVFTGEVAAPNAVGIWTDAAGQPGAPLGFSAPFNTVLFKSWQGAMLNSTVNVVAGQTYWVVWDPTGGEQAAVNNVGIQQTYWGNTGGTVAGGGSWFGPFSFTDRRWKFRLICGKKPCDGNNYANDNHLNNVSTGGPMIGIRWVPAQTETLARIEVYTGEAVQTNAIGIWSTTGGVNPQPLAPLAASAPWTSTLAKGWQGGDLLTPLTVTGGTEYWVVWDPGSGQQSSLTGDPLDIQQTYWGSNVGTVGGGGASWFGPFSFPDRRYKFRMFCRPRDCGPGQCIGGSYCDSCQCYSPASVISQTFCKCKLLDPACGIGECINGSYCTGPYCPFGVCYIPSHPISLAMCSGQAPICKANPIPIR